MKKFLAMLGIVTTLCGYGLIYPATMQIVDIDYNTDVVTLETSTGFTYEMTGAEDYNRGDLVSLVMWSNGTDVITDDIILSARYSGYSLFWGAPGEVD